MHGYLARAPPKIIPLVLALLFVLPAFAGAAPPAASEPSRAIWIDPAIATAVAAEPDGLHLILLAFEAVPEDPVLDRIRTLGLDPIAFRHVPVVAVLAPRDALDPLEALPGLVSVTLDKPLEWYGPLPDLLPDLLPDVVPAGRPGNWGGTGDEITRADRARALGYDGAGVGVAVIDTGVNGHHPGLRPRELGGPLVENVKLVAGRDQIVTRLPPGPANLYLEGQLDTDTTGGHGSHTAGIVAGSWTRDGLLGGRAPGADLVGIGVGETLAILWVVAAFDYILENQARYNIRVVNNSWGLGGPYNPLDPVNIATRMADEAGIVVVFSAGNSGPAGRTLNSYSQAPHVLAVGATTLTGAVAGFSSRGDPVVGKEGPDLVAPGRRVVAPRNAPVSAMDASARTAYFDAAVVPAEELLHYRVLSGTSMSAPQVAGVAALVVQANPSLTSAQVRQVLVDTARPIFGFDIIDQGAGMVDAEAAVLAALGAPVPERDWVQPDEVEQEGDVHRVGFTGAILGAPDRLSAVRHELYFPVRLPAEAVDVRVSWELTGGNPLEDTSSLFTLYVTGPDGQRVETRELATGTGTVRGSAVIQLDADTLTEHARPGWNGGYWKLLLWLKAGAATYAVDADVRYTDGVLPDVVHVAPPPPPPLPPRVTRGPIVIESEADFTAANGVTSGSGTEEDPYLIENWDISPGVETGIVIGGPVGTAAHVVVRNVRVHDTTQRCIDLTNAVNVRVEESLIDGCGWGIYVGGRSGNIQLVDNVFRLNERGVGLYGVTGALIEGNLFDRDVENAIASSQGAASGGAATTDVRLVENTFLASKVNLITPAVTGFTLERNAFSAGAHVNFNIGSQGHVVSGSRWLDGRPDYRTSILTAETPDELPINTIIDAGSDRVLDANGGTCFDDAIVDVDPTRTLVQVTWEFGDGTASTGDERPCHEYADATGTYEARLVVTLQDAAGSKLVLEDTVPVG